MRAVRCAVLVGRRAWCWWVECLRLGDSTHFGLVVPVEGVEVPVGRSLWGWFGSWGPWGV